MSFAVNGRLIGTKIAIWWWRYVIAQNITGLYKITTVVEFKMNIYTCTYFKQQTVIRLGTIFTQVRLALAMIQVNASVLHLSV